MSATSSVTFENSHPTLPHVDLSGLNGSLRLAMMAISKLHYGRLEVTLPDGRQMVSIGKEPGPSADIQIHRPRMARRCVMGGNVALGETYMDEDWSTRDLAKLLLLLHMNEDYVEGSISKHWWFKLYMKYHQWRTENTKRGSRKNISYHYDLGNDFYREWLDKSMTYSSAYFEPENPSKDLTQGQMSKYQKIADLINAGPNSKILEIGCGWGGFAEYVARHRQSKVTGVTLSAEQLEFAQRRVFEAGLAGRVELRLQDYRDIPENDFDGVASIEMFEAVGESYWPSYFQKVRDALKPGGKAALQIITIEDHLFDSYRRGTDFIQRFIFPGGLLPSRQALLRETSAADLEWRDIKGFRLDYADTLAQWRETFLARWYKIQPMGFDERFKRMWEFYLAYCEAGFRTGHIDVVHLALQRN